MPLRSRVSWLLGAPAALVLTALLAIPFANVIRLSLSPQPSAAAGGGFVFANYIEVLTDPFYLGILGYTILLAACVTAVSAIIGFFVAYSLWVAPERWKSLLVLVIISPLMISLVIRVYGWVILLGDAGVINTVLIRIGLVESPAQLLFTHLSVFLGMLHVETPFMILMILAAMERIDPATVSAAESLGATKARAIWEIVLPLSRTGIAAGATLVFTLCMTAFVTPQLLGSSATKVLTTQIYKDFMIAFNWPIGSTIAVILCLCSLGAVLFGNAIAERIARSRGVQ